MPTLILSTVLAAASGAPTVAVPGWSGVNIAPETVGFFASHFAQQLRLAGVPVTSRSEIEAQLGLERSRQLLGCTSESSACFAEIAGALGTGAIAIGTVARLGEAYQLDVKIVRTPDGLALAAASARATSEHDVLDTLSAFASQMAVTLGAQAPAPSRARPAVIVPGALALAAAVGAGVCLGLARSEYSALSTPPSAGASELPFATADSYRHSGPVFLWSGVAAAGVAVVAAALFVVAWVMSP